MKDLIEREDAIDVVHKSIFEFFDICNDDEESPITDKDEQLLKINKTITTRIKALPSAQSERKTGWTIYDRHTIPYQYICSECGAYHRAMYDFCPSCGADMRGEQDDSI